MLKFGGKEQRPKTGTNITAKEEARTAKDGVQSEGGKKMDLLQY